MAESEASSLLHMLQSELSGAKSQWEYLEDRITNGYKDAYKLHKGALDKMKNAKIASREAMMFVLSAISVGFAGGIVGGLLAPWVRQVQTEFANAVIRTGVQDAAKRMTQESMRKLVPDKPKDPGGEGSLYVPVSAEAFDHYLDTKEELDGCFAIVNDRVQKLIDQSNAEQWPRALGQSILDSFRANCPLLRDRPDPQKDLPARTDVSRSAELAMWVAWANENDSKRWDVRYRILESGPEPMGYSDKAKEKFHEEVRRNGGLFDGVERQTYDMQVYGGAVRELKELNPVVDRIKDLKKWEAIKSSYGFRSQPDVVLDLRKLRALRLDTMADLPFTKMKGLDFATLSNLQLRGKFLDGLSEVRPFHFK